jgi:hypothetical protein
MPTFASSLGEAGGRGEDSFGARFGMVVGLCKACFKNVCGRSEIIAQGLKPLVIRALFGTTEVVP